MQIIRKFQIEHTVFSKDVKGAFDKHQGLFIKSVLHQTLMRRKTFEVFLGKKQIKTVKILSFIFIFLQNTIFFFRNGGLSSVIFFVSVKKIFFSLHKIQSTTLVFQELLEYICICIHYSKKHF